MSRSIHLATFLRVIARRAIPYQHTLLPANSSLAQGKKSELASNCAAQGFLRAQIGMMLEICCVNEPMTGVLAEVGGKQLHIASNITTD